MKLVTLFLVSSSSLLLACNSANNTTDAATRPLEKSTVRSLDHRSPGKTTAPVEVSYQLLDKPALSTPLRIEVSMKPLIAASAIKLEYTVDGNINSVDPSTQASFNQVAAGQATKHIIQVVPRGDGQHHVNVFVTLVTQDGQPQSTVLMIPVTVGVVNPNQKPEHPNKAFIQQDSQGQSIISVPAQETR